MAIFIVYISKCYMVVVGTATIIGTVPRVPQCNCVFQPALYRRKPLPVIPFKDSRSSMRKKMYERVKKEDSS